MFLPITSIPYCIGQMKIFWSGTFTQPRICSVCAVSLVIIIKDVPAHWRLWLYTWLRLSYQTISHPKLTIHLTQMTLARDDDKKKTWAERWHISYAKLIDNDFLGSSIVGGPHPEKRNTTQLKNLQSKVLNIGAIDRLMGCLLWRIKL